MRIYIINGPNLNLIGIREPEIYGNKTFEDFIPELNERFPDIELHYFQTNHEGEIIDLLQKIGFEDVKIILNAGAYTHTSIAISDTLSAIKAPIIEVHISDIYARESFRHHSYIKQHALMQIVGKGIEGYAEGIQYFIDKLNS
jgi:3-dehydroquinate dehydratase II